MIYIYPYRNAITMKNAKARTKINFCCFTAITDSLSCQKDLECGVLRLNYCALDKMFITEEKLSGGQPQTVFGRRKSTLSVRSWL